MFKDKTSQLEAILEMIADELDIPKSKFEDAKAKYEAVGNWLDANDSPLHKFHPRIFAQGSIKLGTCVKPLGKDEFDIDLVCRLQLHSSVNQDWVYNAVGERLRAYGKYKKILEPKNRCWRLNYAGDFHMDILPAIPDTERNQTALLIPDKALRAWEITDPEGYSTWFFNRMSRVYSKLYDLAKANVENVPEYTIKTPLQRAIQLLKRHRDIKFQNDLDDKPISIIITTLAAKAYNNEEQLIDALMNIISGMPDQFDIIGGELAVLNPVNDEENFADKWRKHPQRKEKFLQWLSELKSDFESMLNIENFPEIGQRLSFIFGNKIVTVALKKYSDTFTEFRKSGTLRIGTQTGLLGTSGIPIVKNTFYGDE